MIWTRAIAATFLPAGNRSTTSNGRRRETLGGSIEIIRFARLRWSPRR
jgi:hypothetical protein